MSTIQQLDFLREIESPIDALWTPDDIFRNVSEAVLVRFEEDKRIERKPAQFPDSGLGVYLSMWANTAPSGGLIVVGQRDKKGFDGLNAQGSGRWNALEGAGRVYCPDAPYTCQRVGVTNVKGEKDFVLVFRVPYNPTRVVKTNQSEAYIRVGESKHKMTPDEVRGLEKEKRQVPFEAEPCAIAYPDGFDQSAIGKFAETIRKDRGIEDDRSDEEMLCVMRLGRPSKDGFVPNVACALLFANDPRDAIPGSRIHFLRFEGEKEGTGENWNAVKDEFVDGTIPQLITRTARVLTDQLRTFSRLDDNRKFYAQDEYPPTAWYEAVVNACVHRSYDDGLKNAPIFVKMFDNRLIVESPGPFPSFVTPENIYQSHNPKNPILMEALRYLEYVKCANEGTKRMRDKMIEWQLPVPDFNQDREGTFVVRVTLRNNVNQRKAWVDKDVSEIVGAALASILSKEQIRVLNFVAENGEISVSDAQRLTGMSWPAAKKMLAGFADAGILVHRIRPSGKGHDLERDPQARFMLPKR